MSVFVYAYIKTCLHMPGQFYIYIYACMRHTDTNIHTDIQAAMYTVMRTDMYTGIEADTKTCTHTHTHTLI